MRRGAALVLAGLASCAGGAASPRDLRYEALLTRDAWGVPHITGRGPADVAYALGQAQCEDRLEDVLRTLHAGSGRLAELEGDAALPSDRLALAFRHRGAAAQDWPALPLAVQQIVEAFVRGINDWIAEHPRSVPAPGRRFDALDVLAAHRRFLVAPEIERARAEAEGRPVPVPRGNAWVLNAARSATGRPALFMEPAAEPSRFYEAHLRGGDLDVWGLMPVGLPLVHAGATSGAAFALVPGGADSADAFELRLDPVDFDEYEWEGRFIAMDLVRVSIKVLRKGRLEVSEERLRTTRHGPVQTTPGGTPYAARCAAAGHARGLEELWRLNLARSSADVRAALALDLLSGLDAVWAAADGRIGWARLGRVPERAAGHDWSRLVPGWSPLTFDSSPLPFVRLAQFEDPPAGFIQACGSAAGFTTPGLRFRAEDFPPGALGETTSSPRALRAVELLSGGEAVDLALARELAFDAKLPDAGAWREILLSALAAAGDPPEFREAAGRLRDWDLSAGRASSAASIYLYWRAAALRRPSGPLVRDSAAVSDTPDVRREALDVLREALGDLRRVHERTEIPWGEIHRLRRGGRQWSLDGDDVLTLRGRNPVAFVHLGDPPLVHAVSPGGQSDDPTSPNFSDQAPLFADGRWRPLPWTAAEIFAQRRAERAVSGPR